MTDEERQLRELLDEGVDDFDVMLRGLHSSKCFLGGLGDPDWVDHDGVMPAPKQRETNLNPRTVELLRLLPTALPRLLDEVKRLRRISGAL